MTLQEVGIVIGKNIEIRHRSIKDRPVMVSFASTEVKEKGFLGGAYGAGKTVGKAKADYCKRLRGKLLVVDAYSGNRKEIQLPSRITIN